jgi:hypothetical protein
VADIQHEIHSVPLLNRLIDEQIREWLDTRTSIALATVGDIGQFELGQKAGIVQMRHLHLDNYSYTLVARIIEHLDRAGLLVRKG